MRIVRRLALLRLEDRTVPAVWNNPWPDASHLTLSFAPDGTAVGDQVSALFASLDAIAPAAAWKREVMRAFATWAVNANINIALTGDGGAAFGSAGSPQGDARFGDIRIAGYPMGGDGLAFASPYDASAGTWAGDVKINLGINYGIGGAGTVDLFSALLHEAGHVFGLDHSPDPASPMYEHYLGPRTGLIAADIARLQAIYGARTPDSYEGTAGNETIAQATPLNLALNGDGTLGMSVAGDVTTLNDKDVYSFNSGLLGGSAFVKLRSGGLSLLTGRITVLNAAGVPLASVVATDPVNGDIALSVDGLVPLQNYYIRVESGTADVFGVGAYQLEVTQLPLVSAISSTLFNQLQQVSRPLLSLLADEDLHTNDSPLTATLLPAVFAQADSRFDFGYRGAISDNTDRDFYRVVAPANGTVLTALVWTMPNSTLMPRVHIYNAAGQQLPANVLVIDGSTHVIQLTNATPGATYFVEVAASDTPDAGRTGNYFLGVDFGTTATPLSTFQSVNLAASQPVVDAFLETHRTKLFCFLLDVQSAGGVAGSASVTIVDQFNHVVWQRTASTTEPVSGTVVLRPGRYLFRFREIMAVGASLPNLAVALMGKVIDDPIGPRPADPTENSSGDSGTGDDGSYEWTGRDSGDPWQPPPGGDPITTV